MYMRLTAAGLLGGALCVYGQLSFEVASVKLHPGVIEFSADPAIRGRRVVATASTLLDFVTYAYGVRYDQISGAPGWAGSEHYDLEAVAGGEGPLAPDRSKQMVQTLLQDRFQLRLHFDTQEVPMYALVVAKGGPKLKVPVEDAKPGSFTRTASTGLHVEVVRGSMEDLAHRLSGNGSGRPVINKTGLTGEFAYTLEYFPNTSVPPADSAFPPLSNALKAQLGLRLEPTKGQIQRIVIDHAEKPGAN